MPFFKIGSADPTLVLEHKILVCREYGTVCEALRPMRRISTREQVGLGSPHRLTITEQARQ
jgi:hypothetical protein